MDACLHIVEVSGFTGERVNEFFGKFASGCTEEEKNSVKFHCNVALCVHMYKFAMEGETPNLNTIEVRQ